MAQRRMFSKKITETDQFLDLPMSTQCLYFHLNMSADDDGFVSNAKTIRRMIGASDDDLKLLMGKEFIIPFESGVVVIKDWKIHNYIRSDRYNETVYKEEKKLLEINENGQYKLDIANNIPNDIPSVIPTVYQRDTQVRLGKVRLGKDRVVKVNKEDKTQALQPNSYVTSNNANAEKKDDNNNNRINSPAYFFENNGFGTISPHIRDRMSGIYDDFLTIEALETDIHQLIIKALEKAIEYNARNWAYAEKILFSWHNKGYKTISEVDAAEKQYQAKKNNYYDASIPEEKSHEALEVERRTKELLDATIIPDDMEFI